MKARFVVFVFLSLTLLVSISGCSFLTSPDLDNSSSQDNLDSTSKKPTSSPPGLSSGQIVSIAALLEAHENVLESRSYHLSFNSVSASRDLGIDISVNSDGGFMYKYKSSKRGVETVRWSDSENVYIRHSKLNRTNYLERLATENEVQKFAQFTSGVVGTFLNPDKSTVSDTVTRNGESMFWITSSKPSTSSNLGSVNNYRAIALVDSSGVVRELYVDYETYKNGESISYSLSFEYNLSTNPSLTSPSWAGRDSVGMPDNRDDIEIISQLDISDPSNLVYSVTPQLSGGSRIVDTHKMITDHIVTLGNEDSYTYLEKTVRTSSNYRIESRRTVKKESAQLFIERDEFVTRGSNTSFETTELWSNESIRVVADRRTTPPRYIFEKEIGSDLHLEEFERRMERYFSPVNSYLYGPVEANLYWLVTLSPSYGFSDSGEFTAVAVIEKTSDYTLIQDVNVEYLSSTSDESLTYTYELSELGNTTVEKPRWFDRAVNKSTSSKLPEAPQTVDFTARVVDKLPSSAVVLDSNTTKLTDIETVEKLFMAAVDNRPDEVTNPLYGSNFLRVKQAFNKLRASETKPFYSVYYIRYNGHLLRVELYKKID